MRRTTPQRDQRVIAPRLVHRAHEVASPLRRREERAEETRPHRGVVARENEEVGLPRRGEGRREAAERPPARPVVLDRRVAGSRIGRALRDADEHAAAQRLQGACGALGERPPSEHDIPLRLAEPPSNASGQNHPDRLGHGRILLDCARGTPHPFREDTPASQGENTACASPEP